MLDSIFISEFYSQIKSRTFSSSVIAVKIISISTKFKNVDISLIKKIICIT